MARFEVVFCGVRFIGGVMRMPAAETASLWHDADTGETLWTCICGDERASINADAPAGGPVCFICGNCGREYVDESVCT